MNPRGLQFLGTVLWGLPLLYSLAAVSGFLLVADCSAFANKGIHVGLTPWGWVYCFVLFLVAAVPALFFSVCAFAAHFHLSRAAARDRAETTNIPDINKTKHAHTEV